MHEAPYTTIAYYRQPAMDGIAPGQYYINTYTPETRPRYEAEALAFHESIPGHHLQIAIAQELDGLPEFRKHLGVTAFVEGWALYTERLADEMGLYSGDLDRHRHAVLRRVARLPAGRGHRHARDGLDPRAGDRLHARAHRAARENNIENEVDRYITWPGQALAYKVGQLEILDAARGGREARSARASTSSAFHDVVLRNGAVTLPVLREQVDAWIEAETAAK